MKREKDYTLLALLIPFIIACLFSCSVLKPGRDNCPTNNPKFFYQNR